MTEKRCSQCNRLLTEDNFHKRSDMPWLHRADCKACYNATRAKKRAEKKAALLPNPVDVVTDNPFHWRTFVQPVPMKAGKWEQPPRPDQAVNTRFTQYQ